VTRAILAPRARRELAEAITWLARDSPAAAKTLRAAVDDALVLIGKYPEVGALRPELVDPPIRFWRVRGFAYLLIYRPITPRPRVIRVVHGARDLPDLLRDLGPS
jgi:toxin ParE1/3/4